MNKKFYVASFCSLIATAGLIIPTVGSAASLASASGKAITIAARTQTPILPAFNFTPSPQITMAGTTSATAFSVAAVHDSVLGKENGEAYAMTSEASGLFVYKAPPTGYTVVVGASAGLLTANYKLPDGTTHTAPETQTQK